VNIVDTGEGARPLDQPEPFLLSAAAANISSIETMSPIPILQLLKLNLTLKKSLLLSAVFNVGFM
jgi:hypothetical protein